jgi:tetratricopeptide (TPR) repeat protein
MHAKIIKKFCPDINLYPLKNTHHATIEIFAESSLFVQLVNNIINNKVCEISSLVNERRKTSFVRRREIAKWVAHRNPMLSLKILDNHQSDVKTQDMATALFDVAQNLDKAKNFNLAAKLYIRAHNLSPNIERYVIRGAQALSKSENPIEGLKLLLDNKNYFKFSSHYLNAIAGLYIDCGDLSNARLILIEAISQKCHIDFFCRISMVAARLGLKDEAVMYCNIAISLFPEEKKGYLLMLEILDFLKDKSRKEMLYSEYAKIRPDFFKKNCT